MPDPVASEAVLAQFVQRARQICSLPAVVMRVLELTRDPIVDVRALQQCVASDPALTGKLLRVVNSSLFGLSKQVGDLNQAITLLGIQRLKMLVLGFSLPTQTTSGVQPAVLERYWRHALIKSVTARELAESLWKMPGDEAFVAALLQDLGLLVLVQDLGDSYIKFLSSVWSAGNDPREMQMEVMGFDHVQLTVKLLEDWGFPPTMLRAIAAPPDPQRLILLQPAEKVVPQILDLSELLTRFLLDRQVRWLDKLLDSGKAYLGLKIEQLYAVLERIETMTPQLAAAMSVPWKEESDYVRLLQDAHQRQAEAINQMATELLAPPRRPIDVLTSAAAPPNSKSASGSPADSPPRNTKTNQTTHNGKGPSPSSKTATATSVATVAVSSLTARLTTVIASSRQSRLPMSLVLVQLDDVENLLSRYGERPVAKLVQDIRSLIHEAADTYDNVSIEAISASRLSLILTDADRQQAIAVARQVLDGVRRWADATPPGSRPLSVSIGLASLTMPPRNFPALELLQAAERCLNGAKLSGGNGIKSIEIC